MHFVHAQDGCVARGDQPPLFHLARGGLAAGGFGDFGELGERLVALLYEVIALAGQRLYLAFLRAAGPDEFLRGQVAVAAQGVALGLQRSKLPFVRFGQLGQFPERLVAFRGEAVDSLLLARGEEFFLFRFPDARLQAVRLGQFGESRDGVVPFLGELVPLSGERRDLVFLRFDDRRELVQGARLLAGEGLKLAFETVNPLLQCLPLDFRALRVFLFFPREGVALAEKRCDLLLARGVELRGVREGGGLALAFAFERFGLALARFHHGAQLRERSALFQGGPLEFFLQRLQTALGVLPIESEALGRLLLFPGQRVALAGEGGYLFLARDVKLRGVGEGGALPVALALEGLDLVLLRFRQRAEFGERPASFRGGAPELPFQRLRAVFVRLPLGAEPLGGFLFLPRERVALDG